jgi:WhiB family redox-sensing transcriptional regulator
MTTLLDTATSTAAETWDAPTWRANSACRDLDPNLFFPVGVTGEAVDQIRAAKAVCRACPVQAQCLEFALSTNQEYGVWGGADEEERRGIRRTRRARARAEAQAERARLAS